MSNEDFFITLGQKGLRFLLIGGLSIICLMVIYTILKTLKADYRTRGFWGFLLGIIKLTFFIAIVALLIFLAVANNWLGALDSFIEGFR
jgi:hypothetical protein